uniref:Uncharacterized protein n=1 Tax=Oryza glumipatula TaxID=40148 RepID=A0A0D9ZTM6_9ORYZ
MADPMAPLSLFIHCPPPVGLRPSPIQTQRMQQPTRQAVSRTQPPRSISLVPACWPVRQGQPLHRASHRHRTQGTRQKISVLWLSYRRGSSSSPPLPPRRRRGPPLRVLPFFLYPPPPSPVISKGRDVEDATVGCPVCGVFMQDADPNLPGFFKNPSRLSDDEMGEDWSPLAAELDGFIGNDEGNDLVRKQRLVANH